MKMKPASDGFALPLVLWLIALMVAAIAMLAMTASNRHLQSSTMADRVEAETAARAGINYAVARMDARLGEQRWLPDGQPHQWNYGGHALTITIRDEWGKFDLNAGDPDVLRALMQLQDIPPEQISAIINGLGAMRAARLSRQEGLNDANNMPTRIFNVASLSQLPGVSPETLASLAPELTVYSGRSLPDITLADARMRTALVAAGKAAGMPVGNANGSGLYNIDVVASRPDHPPGRVNVVLQGTPRYDGGIEIRWLAWEHGRWQQ